MPQAPLEPPTEPLTGDSHAHLLEPMRAFAESLGFTVSFESIPGATGGWCDHTARRIVVDSGQPANAQLNRAQRHWRARARRRASGPRRPRLESGRQSPSSCSAFRVLSPSMIRKRFSRIGVFMSTSRCRPSASASAIS